MRNLILCRGAAGCGKSTWLKENDLSKYAIAADDVRLLFQSPVWQPDGSFSISQANDRDVWAFMFQLLEKRMARGELTIIDATHSRASQISDYRKLCEKYRYRCYVLDFTDIHADEILRRNKSRPEHKQVPEGAIMNMIARIETQPNPGWTVTVKPETFYDVFGKLNVYNFNHYEKIHHIGDLHGCLDPLKKYLSNGINPGDYYIFIGDYLDRGPQNREMLEYLCDLSSNNKNIMFLQGNHERWLWNWAMDEEDEIKSSEFRNGTMPQLEGFDKKKAREFCRKLAQLAHYNYGNKRVLVTHGGVPGIPTPFVASDELIKGVGQYEDAEDVQEAFMMATRECLETEDFNYYQVHGHRNIFDQSTVNGNCFNICEHVEMGGNLRVVTLSHDQGWVTHEIRNTNFISLSSNGESTTVSEVPEDANLSNLAIIQVLRSNKYIDEKKFPTFGNISSFNFSRDAFYDKVWNDVTVRARSLYMNTNTGDVVARAYEKFFNVNERSFTKLAELGKVMSFPATAYRKENGFLGLVGYDKESDQVIYATKSSLQGDYVGWFKEQVQAAESYFHGYLKEMAKDKGACFVFECIDPVRDPHIIKYEKPGVVLLDIVQANMELVKYPQSSIDGVVKDLRYCHVKNINTKKKMFEFETYREFYLWYRKIYKYDYGRGDRVEGFVIECPNGFTVKVKTGYYNTWKWMRGLRDSIKSKRVIEMARMTSQLENILVAWMKVQPEEVLKLDIITIRNMFWEQHPVLKLAYE